MLLTLHSFWSYFKGSTKTSMLCMKSTTCSPQLPEYLTVRNSQKQKQTVAKAAGLCTPFKLQGLIMKEAEGPAKFT